jgi:hypothetical protein
VQVDLLLLNGAVFSTLAVGLAIRLRRKSNMIQMGTVYANLSITLSKRFVDLPPGFTLREGIARARLSAREIDWVSIQAELDSYETFKFGNGPQPTGQYSETLRLIRVLGGRRI